MKRKAKINLVFQEYPLFYQPYIPPVIDALNNNVDIDLAIRVYEGKSRVGVEVMPSYFYRRLMAKLYIIFNTNKPKLNYSEIIFLKNKDGIVHIQHSYLFSKILRLLEFPNEKRPKIVITLRGGDTYVKPWLQDKWRDFYRDFGNKVDAFVVMSRHQKQYLHEKWQIDLERIHVIPISFGQTFNMDPKFPNSDQLKIVSVFRMCWEKNIEGNLRVIQCLKAKGLPVHYTIYGDGPDLGQVYYLVDKLGLQDEVEIKGKVSNEQLKESLGAYDFILQLSLSESFGVSVVEAQSLGIPAMVSNSGGLPEAIVPTESGFCVAAHDALKASEHIEQLWRDKALYFKFSERAISFSHQHFTISHEIEALTKLYQELMAKQDS